MPWAIRRDSWQYEAVEVVKETAKTATYLDRRWDAAGRETRCDLHKLFPWRGNETEARRLTERLNSAKAERDRRRAAADGWFNKECAKILGGDA